MAAASALKPQLAWLVPPALLIGGHFRVLSGVLLGALLLVVATLALVGSAHAWDWLPLALARECDLRAITIGGPGLVAVFFNSPGVSLVSAVGFPVLAIGLCWRWRRRLRGDVELAIATGVSLSLICSIHIWTFDLVLMLLPLAVVARRGAGLAIGLALALSVATLAEMHLGVLPRPEALVLIGGGVLMARRVLENQPGEPLGDVAELPSPSTRAITSSRG